MATDRLDIEDLLRELTASGWKVMPARTVIGHVHLHVGNLAKAMKFYREILGLNFTATYPGAYFFAGKYHHHIATNTWLGTSIQLASSEYVGLNHFASNFRTMSNVRRLQNSSDNTRSKRQHNMDKRMNHQSLFSCATWMV